MTRGDFDFRTRGEVRALENRVKKLEASRDRWAALARCILSPDFIVGRSELADLQPGDIEKAGITTRKGTR